MIRSPLLPNISLYDLAQEFKLRSMPESLTIDAPFNIETKKPIKLSAEDEGTIVKGNIDVLVIQQRFWILVIESKQARFDVMTALLQALAYMLASPNLNQPTFGLLLNGREFVFVRLDRVEIPQYSLSKAFSILNPESDLLNVLQILKYIGELIRG